jgi:hypothetical protein
VDEDTGDVYTRVGNQWKIKTKHPWYGTDNNQTATDNAEPIYVMSSWLGIGTNAGPTSNNERLFVNGGIRTTSNIYADYVFEEYLEGSSTLNSDYKFKSLKEVESFIKVNKHLPGVTGIKDLQKTELGYSYNLTELSIQSLEKIEELYLHVIEQQKIIEDLKIKNEALKVRLHKIETALGL